MLSPNTVLKRQYRIIRCIGRGGMGAVYEALDDELDALVALKETFAETDSQREAFEREAKLLANLEHDAFPRVMRHFFDGEGQYLVMELVRGNDLQELFKLRESPFAPARVLEWADQLLDALEELHSYPIIHRDIKPSNLKLTKKDRIKLLDFGIAKGTAGQMAAMSTDQSGGGYTAHYAPLEQILRSDWRWGEILRNVDAEAVERIQQNTTDARSDLYALGATLYHLMTSVVPPPDAPTRALAVWTGKPDRLRPAYELNPLVPHAVSDVLLQAMAIERNERPATAKHLRQMLREAVNETLSVPPTILSPELEARARQRRELEARRRAEEEEQSNKLAEEARMRAEADEQAEREAARVEAARRAEGERLRREAEANQSAAEQQRRLAEAEAARLAAEAQRREEAERERKEAEELKRRESEAAARQLAETERLSQAAQARKIAEAEAERVRAGAATRRLDENRRLKEDEKAQTEADRKREENAAIVTIPAQGRVTPAKSEIPNHPNDKPPSVLRRETRSEAASQEMIVPRNRRRAMFVIWLGVLVLLGLIMAFAARWGLWANRTNSNVRDEAVQSPATATNTATNVDRLERVPTFEVTPLGPPIISPDELFQVALSTDGQMLASTGGNKVRLWKISAPDNSIELEDKSAGRSEKRWLAVAFSPDGQTLASGNDQGALQIWRLSDHSSINQLAISLVNYIFRVGFSADGQTLLSAGLSVGNAKRIHLWRASDLSALGDMTLEPRKTIIAMDLDQRVVAINDPLNGLQLWSIENQSYLRQLQGDVKKALIGAFSPDGEVLALSNNDGTLQLIRVADGRVMNTLIGPKGFVVRVTISRDGSVIAGGWNNGTVQVWRMSDGKLIKSLTEQKQGVRSLAFSADGRVLATASADRTIRLWQISVSSPVTARQE